ncbi:hypothetical protein I79_004456 [Cricetulus griseus]|uniref:Uncharacterized protein n=1 Tax=Cricetulus griseus TaxID=10029 RepID=G3H2N8_CRIGR|nr:hypothetical protein I79_004456 [Cricetulus griseus]
MGVNQDLFDEWWNLVSFDHEIVLRKKTLVLMREKMVPRLVSVGSHFLPLQG